MAQPPTPSVATQLVESMTRLLRVAGDPRGNDTRSVEGKLNTFVSIFDDLEEGLASLRVRQQDLQNERETIARVAEEQKREAAPLTEKKKEVVQLTEHQKKEAEHLESLAKGVDFNTVTNKIVEDVKASVSNIVGDLKTSNLSSSSDLSSKVKDVADGTARVGDVTARVSSDVENLRTSNEKNEKSLAESLAVTTKVHDTVSQIMDTFNTFKESSDRSLHGLSEKVTNVHTQVASPQKALQEASDRILESITTNVTDKIQGLQTSSTDSLAALQERFKKVDDELGMIKEKTGRVHQVETDLEKAREDKIAAEEKAAQATNEVKALEGKITKLEDETKSLRDACQEASSKSTQLDAVTRELQDRVKGKDTIITRLEDQIKKKDTTIANQKAQVKERDTTIATLGARIKERDNTIDTQGSKIRSLDPLAKKVEQLDTVVQERDQSLKEVSRLQSLIDNGVVTARDKDKVSKLERRMKDLEEQVKVLIEASAPQVGQGQERQDQAQGQLRGQLRGQVQGQPQVQPRGQPRGQLRGPPQDQDQVQGPIQGLSSSSPGRGFGELPRKRQRTETEAGPSNAMTRIPPNLATRTPASIARPSSDPVIMTSDWTLKSWRDYINQMVTYMRAWRPGYVVGSDMTRDLAFLNMVWITSDDNRVFRLEEFMQDSPSNRWYCLGSIVKRGWRSGSIIDNARDADGYCLEHKSVHCIHVMKAEEIPDLVVMRVKQRPGMEMGIGMGDD